MSTATPPNLLPPELMAQLERLELVTRKIFRGRMKGERRSKRKGQSVEFADFRNYVPGDDLRLLDWNLYARLEKLILKLFLEEEDLHFFGPGRRLDVDGFRHPQQAGVRQAARRRARLRGPHPRRPRADRNPRPGPRGPRHPSSAAGPAPGG